MSAHVGQPRGDFDFNSVTWKIGARCGFNYRSEHELDLISSC